MNISELKDEVLIRWLTIDFENIFSRLGFGENLSNVSEKLIFDTVRCLDYETTMEKTPSVNYVITLIALMWEYIDEEKYDVRKIIIKFLSRLGYPTSAIIVDKEFDKKDCSFLSLESPIEQLLTTLNQDANSVRIGDYEFLLTDFQMRIWNSMSDEHVIGISAPTSAGKSFVILLKLLGKLKVENFDVVYIVPTLSLLNQVMEDFNSYIKLLGVDDCKVMSSFAEHTEESKYIYVLTQEKAIAAFSEKANAFSKRMVLVADEIQNIERIKEDDDERAKILYDTLSEFRYKENVEQIILAGPRIVEMEKVGESLFGFETEDITSTDCPVLNLTYSIFKDRKRYYLKQYSTLNSTPITRLISSPEIIQGYGQKQYTEKYLSFLNAVITKLGGQQNIVFSPTAATARKIACSIAGQCIDENELTELIEYFKETVHPSYSMCLTLLNGVAYHHGKLPAHVRRTIEKAIHKKWIYNVACTTTLLQGVNLPAQNIIIRNPHLYINRHDGSAELSNYEMANLRGRAGRLMKDFIGRTFVLDESSFADSDDFEQMTLFEDTTKELPTNYEERYEKYQQNIQDMIITSNPIDSSMARYGDLVSYIRQSVLRYGDNAQQRMENVGVRLTKEQVAAIVLKLEMLTVPKDICAKNRYWDPFVLDVIYKEYNEKVPASPLEHGCKAKIDRMLKFLRDTDETKAMYERQIPVHLQHGVGRNLLVNLCVKWSQEKSLAAILDRRYKEDIEDEIEKVIEILQNTVSYKVPLLLKPIFDIKNPNSTVLSSMQAGACNLVSKKLIEMGVPREAALYLNGNLFNKCNISGMEELELEDYIREVIAQNINQLPYWTRVQVEFL